jgi:hypothetical protein
MNEKELLLKTLGWSDNLINEVTRMSTEINGSANKLTIISDPNDSYRSFSGNSLKASSHNIDTYSTFLIK